MEVGKGVHVPDRLAGRGQEGARLYPYEEIRRRRPTDELSRFFADCKPPWFFIGCDNSVDRTMDLEPYVCVGNLIRPELLQHLFPGSKRWIYVHPTTFEETEFPSEGISIENDGE